VHAPVILAICILHLKKGDAPVARKSGSSMVTVIFLELESTIGNCVLVVSKRRLGRVQNSLRECKRTTSSVAGGGNTA
jgi:hypothetical protein